MNKRAVPTRTLGSTGQEVSVIGIGGAHLFGVGGRVPAITLIREAIDRGVTFMENCWDYYEGNIEEWMGDALKRGYRQRVFLTSKIDGRTREAAAGQIDQSLRRLKTDVIDLMQLHEVIRWDDPDRAFAAGGAMEALIAAREAGKIRYIGFTGHKDPEMHLKMLAQDFAWDAVQMPLNLLDAHYDSFQQKVMPVLKQRGIGILGMKPLAGGEIFETGAITGEEALRYVLGLPVDVVITGMESLDDLIQAVAAAGAPPLTEGKLADLLDRMKPYAGKGRHEGYKTTDKYDSTRQNPHWLEEERI